MAKNLVIFAHGFLGFKEKFFIRYWHDTVDYLRSKLDRGLARVEATEVDPTGGTEKRAKELAEQINRFLDSDDQIGKIHIIAHSMGGLDARRLVTPDDTIHKTLKKPVATITTVSTPHRGSPMADFGYDILGPSPKSPTLLRPGQQEIEELSAVLKGIPIDRIEKALELLQDNIGYFKKLFSLNWDGLKELTTWGVPNIKDSPDVRYFSYGGEVWPFGIGGAYLPLPSVPGWLLIYCKEKENDGLVSLKSSSWGTYKGVIPTDHAGQIGFRLSLFDKIFHPVKFNYNRFYLEVVKGLCTRGEPDEAKDILSRI
jgi:triacylglycerol lipase